MFFLLQFLFYLMNNKVGKYVFLEIFGNVCQESDALAWGKEDLVYQSVFMHELSGSFVKSAQGKYIFLFQLLILYDATNKVGEVCFSCNTWECLSEI